VTGAPVGRRLPALVAVAVVLWLRLLPLTLPGVDDPASLTFPGADGREHVYLGDYDGYLFVRHAEHALRTGSPCDAWVDGECRDTLANAPVGRRSRYHGGLHVWAIAGLHRLVTAVAPDFPITSTAYFVPVIGGVLAALLAYATALRLAGPLAGLAAAIAVGANPLFLFRSAGADNDVWNVLLPLGLVWAAAAALAASDLRRASRWMVVAAAFVGLHALTWRGWVLTYGVVVAAVAGRALVLALRARLAAEAGARDEARASCTRTLAALGVFWVAAGIAVWLAGSEDSYLALPLAFVRQLVGAPAVSVRGDPTDLWPDAFEIVAELTGANLRGITGVLGGAPYLIAGWVGMLLCVLPTRGWDWRDAAVVGVGVLAYPGVLVDPAETSQTTLAGVLALPLAAGCVRMALVPRDEPSAGGALIAAVWFVVTLALAFEGQRYVMLLAPAFGLVFGVALGRLSALVVTLAAVRATSPVVAPLAFVALALTIVPFVETSRGVVARYRPRMNDAWWDTLEAIRERTPPDAVVAPWWDFGHWTTLVAGRRVLADGASLGTHVPHWMARALLSPSERQTLGVLRMLVCGSDASGEPEEERGAQAKLRAAGLGSVEARESIMVLATTSRDVARERLRARGIDDGRVEDILASTHCTPPPTYLVLTSAMRGMAGWRALGAWDARHAYAARVARALPEAEAVADMQARLGVSADDARALWRAARATDPSKLEAFIAPKRGFLTTEWVPCTDTAGVWHCPVQIDTGTGRTLVGVRVVLGAPQQSRLVLRRPPPTGGEELVTPGSLVMAGSETISALTFRGAGFPALGILADLPGRRVLLGTPSLLESTFTQLVYLDGRYAKGVEKVDERVGYDGERVTTWKVTGWGG
jgi:dolichyl-diphosphooligosaccharide--protein glycosyltransferase